MCLAQIPDSRSDCLLTGHGAMCSMIAGCVCHALVPVAPHHCSVAASVMLFMHT